MTTRDDSRATTPDATTMIDDDLLLDRLGRGEAPAGDPVAALLSDWRATLPGDEPPDERLAAAAAEAAQRSRRPARRPARWARRAVVATAATALLGGGVAVAAEHARPGNPLWPVTEWLYPDLAGSRSASVAASDAVADARAAIAAGRPEDAGRLLEHATTLAERVREPGERAGLLSDIAALRARVAPPPESLPPVSGEVPAGVPTAPVPSAPTEKAVPPAVTPSVAETPRPRQPTTSTPALPEDTPAPLPSLPLDPTLPAIPGH